MSDVWVSCARHCLPVGGLPSGMLPKLPLRSKHQLFSINWPLARLDFKMELGMRHAVLHDERRQAPSSAGNCLELSLSHAPHNPVNHEGPL